MYPSISSLVGPIHIGVDMYKMHTIQSPLNSFLIKGKIVCLMVIFFFIFIFVSLILNTFENANLTIETHVDIRKKITCTFCTSSRSKPREMGESGMLKPLKHPYILTCLTRLNTFYRFMGIMIFKCKIRKWIHRKLGIVLSWVK